MLVAPGTVVMIVDDDSIVRQSVADILEMEGYEALPLSSGESALAHIAAGIHPAVVILDLWLPGMGSAAFTRRLKAQLSTPVPLLLLTAWPSSRQVGLEVDAVLSKPAEATAIVRTVDKLASSRSAPVADTRLQRRRSPRKAPRPDAARTRQSGRG